MDEVTTTWRVIDNPQAKQVVYVYAERKPSFSIEAKRRLVRSFLIMVIALVYVIFPFDPVPDVIPVAGWADDVLVGAMAPLFAFVSMVTPSQWWDWIWGE